MINAHKTRIVYKYRLTPTLQPQWRNTVFLLTDDAFVADMIALVRMQLF
jgi:hypothetical protein